MSDNRHGGIRDMLDRAGDALGGAVGMASAALGGHSEAMFIQNARVSDLYEVEAARIAVARTLSPEIRRYAQTMIDDHSNSIQQLAKAVRGNEGAAPLPDELDERRSKMVEHLTQASDGDFDSTYVSQQKSAHREALTLFEGYASSGAGTPLGAYASGAIPVLRQHAELLHKLPHA